MKWKNTIETHTETLLQLIDGHYSPVGAIDGPGARLWPATAQKLRNKVVQVENLHVQVKNI